MPDAVVVCARIPHRPVLGWSPGGTKRVIAVRPRFGHKPVHGTPLQIAVSLGLPGSVLMLAIVAAALVALALAVQVDRKMRERSLSSCAAPSGGASQPGDA